ncbi:growth arrest-specific protein 1-like isoform X2 [Arctopsyche grandis]
MWVVLIVVMWFAAGVVRGEDIGSVSDVGCTEAKLRCAFRTGCGRALTNYVLWCSDLVRGVAKCPEACQHALIALTSTEEGKLLMNCACDDDYCQETKQRVEICRAQVLKASQNETVSCRVSQLICAADAQCSTALHYYRHLCGSMFKGKRCSLRCLNSINILKKQEKADKLSTCKCDGFEDYDCPKVQNNMARLCFRKRKTPHVEDVDKTTTEREDLRTNEVNCGNCRSWYRAVALTVFVCVIRLLVPH